MSNSGIEVFQELELVPIKVDLPSIRSSLITQKASDWQHDANRETEINKHSGLTGDIILFKYGGPTLPQARLTLWEWENKYQVSNIVPDKLGQLSVSQYNALLTDFVKQVVSPARSKGGFSEHLTNSIRTLDSWISKDALAALRRFSLLANKSSANSHPADAERWEEFIVAVHRDGKPLQTNILAEWLIKMDEWDEWSARALASDYEKGISLLKTYDQQTH